MMKTKNFLILHLALWLAVVGLTAKAQTIPNAGVEISKAIPPSPDAAALGKYGNIPVSPYTGVPGISIPLYTIKSGDLTLPLSISYHASGIKVEEIASSVGLGWALNAGGAITRTIRGKADEDLNGFIDGHNYVPNINSSFSTGSPYNTANLNYYLNLVSDGTIDGEPDMFNFNFGEYSGKFVFDSHGNVYTIPQQKIKFTYTINSSGSAPYIQQFTALTPDGVTYVFGSNNDGNNAVEFTNSHSNCSANPKKSYATSWYIKSIISPTGHEIDFSYTLENYTVTLPGVENFYQYAGPGNGINSGSNPPTNEYCSSSNTFNSLKISQINFENGNVVISSDSLRRDIAGDSARFVDKITINGSGANPLLKTYDLFYKNTGTRLRLDSLVGHLEPSGTSYKKEKYSFAYNADPWSANALYAQDWWGYYNGQGNQVNGQLTLVPWMNFSYNGTTTRLAGAVRAPDEQSMLGAMLTQITYPTGGYTVFSFECNQESNQDVSGTSSRYPANNLATAFSNDPNSIYYTAAAKNLYRAGMTVTAIGNGVVPVLISASGLGAGGGDPNLITANIWQYISPTDSVNTFAIKNTGDTTIYLPTGNYKIVLKDNKNQEYSSTNTSSTYKYVIAATWANPNPALAGNFITGGVRIHQIADYDGVHAQPFNLKTYQYTLPGQAVSSGWLNFQPIYNYLLGKYNGSAYQGTPGYDYYEVRTAVSNYPLATTQGCVTGYAHVMEVTAGNGQSGEKEYYYTNSQTYPDLPQINSATGNGGTNFPFAPPMNQDWKRGLLTRQVMWKQVSPGNYTKVQQKVNTYATLNQQFNIALKAGMNPTPSSYNAGNNYYSGGTGVFGTLIPFVYTDVTDFTYLNGSVTTDYNISDTTKLVTTTESYHYDPATYLLTADTTVNSKNEKIIQSVTYPYNYSVVAGSGNSLTGLEYLTSKGILNYPVEEVTQKSNTDGSNLRTIKAVLTTYKPSAPVRDSVYEMRSITPVTGFVNSSVGTNYLNKDSHYQPVVSFDSYDSYGNILQERKVYDALHSYIWGHYNSYYPKYNTYPIAEAVNADANSIAYTNFESYNSAGYGNWTYGTGGATTDAAAPMGTNCYSLSSSNTIAKSGLNSSVAYVVSFWAKTGAAVTVTGGTVSHMATGNAKAGWAYYEYQLTGNTSVTVGGSGLIDELRLYPVNALMSTYTYLPLVGIASMCDTRNIITYYNYDNVGRLVSIMDQNRNIIKDYQYNYANQ